MSFILLGKHARSNLWKSNLLWRSNSLVWFGRILIAADRAEQSHSLFISFVIIQPGQPARASSVQIERRVINNLTPPSSRQPPRPSFPEFRAEQREWWTRVHLSPWWWILRAGRKIWRTSLAWRMTSPTTTMWLGPANTSGWVRPLSSTEFYIQFSLCRFHEESLRAPVSPALLHHSHRSGVPLHPWCQGICPGKTSISLPGILPVDWSSHRSSHQEEGNPDQLDPSGVLHRGGSLHRGGPRHFLRSECRHPGLLSHGCCCHRSYGLHIPGRSYILHVLLHISNILNILLRLSATSPTWELLWAPGWWFSSSAASSRSSWVTRWQTRLWRLEVLCSSPSSSYTIPRYRNNS